MTFILPKDLNFETLPIPIDNLVKLSTEPSKKWAVLRYSGIPTELIMKDMAAELKSSIELTNRYRIVSEPRWAQYDGPMVIPFLRRNEVQIQVEAIQ